MDTATATDRFRTLASLPGDDIDVALGALLIGAVVDDSVDPQVGMASLDGLATAGRSRIDRAEEHPLAQINALNEHLFDELGFSGNNDDYYDPKNSLLHRVIESRQGIPITLSLLYIEVGARLGVPLVGIGMPAHFLVRHELDESVYVDPFYRGVMLSERECAERLKSISDSVRWDRAFLTPVTKRAFLARILRNLSAIWVRREEPEPAECMLSMLVALQPDELGHRRDRGMLRYRLGKRDEALEDLEAYLNRATGAPDAWYVRRVVGRMRG
jgi:regulator of sirC expression with transglutaminase-like and TPR domain